MKKRRIGRTYTYDFTGGVRGKYAVRFERGTNLVLLDPDVHKVFPTPQAVNRALRTLANTFKTAVKTRPA